MENSNIDNYILNVKSSLIKTKYIVIGSVAFALASIIICSIIIISGAKMATENIRIIDKQGYSYSSEIIAENKATELQMRSFINIFIKLCYSYNANNIEENLNRALQMGDNSVGGYIQLHTKPNELYHSVRGLGRVAKVEENNILDNLIFAANNSFRVTFIQTISSDALHVAYRVTISGNLSVITPKGVDNPNGLFIINFIENYEKL